MRIPPKLTERPEVSVIMAVKDGAKTLRFAIESLFEQTFSSWELVVINDGSTDETGEILEEFFQRDPSRIRIFCQENQGLTKSLNKAIKLSRGRFLARLDADDINLPHRFEAQLSALRREQLDLVVSRAYKNDTIVPNTLIYIYGSLKYLQFDNFFVHGSYFGKIEIFAGILYNERYRFAQDYDFITRVLKERKRVGYIFEPLYVLGVGPNQISVKKAEDQIAIARSISLSHNNSVTMKYYWSLGSKSLVRKLMKLIWGFFGTHQTLIKKILR